MDVWVSARRFLPQVHSVIELRGHVAAPIEGTWEVVRIENNGDFIWARSVEHWAKYQGELNFNTYLVEWRYVVHASGGEQVPELQGPFEEVWDKVKERVKQEIDLPHFQGITIIMNAEWRNTTLNLGVLY